MGFGLYWIFGFFIRMSSWKLVGWFSSSAELLFWFVITLDYRKICKFITYSSLEAVNITKSLIISGMTNRNWIKFGAVFLLVFDRVFMSESCHTLVDIQGHRVWGAQLYHHQERDGECRALTESSRTKRQRNTNTVIVNTPRMCLHNFN